LLKRLNCRVTPHQLKSIRFEDTQIHYNNLSIETVAVTREEKRQP